MEKPLLIKNNEFIQKVIDTVNGCGLPMILAVNDMEKILDEMRMALDNEYKKEKEEYENSLKGDTEG